MTARRSRPCERGARRGDWIPDTCPPGAACASDDALSRLVGLGVQFKRAGSIRRHHPGVEMPPHRAGRRLLPARRAGEAREDADSELRRASGGGSAYSPASSYKIAAGGVPMASRAASGAEDRASGDIDPGTAGTTLQAPGRTQVDFEERRRFPAAARVPPRGVGRAANSSRRAALVRPAHIATPQHGDRRGARDKLTRYSLLRETASVHLGFRQRGAATTSCTRRGCNTTIADVEPD